VGTLGIVDNDVVDLSNLQRQVAHSNDRIGVPKVDSAEISIHEINPDVNVEKYPVRLGADNIMEIIEGYDVIVDGLDNFPTRYLLNDASVRLQIPVVSASILGFEGQLSVFHPYEGPCYRCLYPTPPPAELAPSCGAAGVLGVLPGVMGLLQSVEVIKLVTGAGDTMAGRLLLYDALGTTFTGAEGPARPRLPDLLARPERDLRRGDGRLPGLRSLLRRRGLGCRASMATIKIPPVLRGSVGGEKEVEASGSDVGEVLASLAVAAPRDRVAALLRGRRAEPLRQRLPERRGRARARRPRHERVRRRHVVILPAMAGGSR
jgi:molybdopterin/thiamine biosynthesis adenylyltransferase